MGKLLRTLGLISIAILSLAGCSSQESHGHDTNNSVETSQLEHHYSTSWSHDAKCHWHACTDAGYEDLRKDEASHTYDDAVTAPTYSGGGYTTHTCIVCGYSYTDSETDRLTYTIVWKNWDGSILQTDHCYEGETPTYNGTPQKAYDDNYFYEFSGWSPTIEPAYSDAIYTAQFTPSQRNTFYVQYNSNGGDVTPNSQTKIRGQALTLSSTKPTKEGHTFIGWNNIFEDTVYSSGAAFGLDKDVTLWAMWEDTCEHCGGTGTYKWTSTCSFCSGTGKRDQCNSCGSYSIKTVIINGIGEVKQCNSCNSTSISTKTCTWCSGKGSSSGSESCPYCDHTGHHGGDGPTVSTIRAREIILQNVRGCEFSKNKTEWQSSPVFENLKPSSSYTFYQRRATNGDIPFGETSKPLTVSTNSTTEFYITYVLNGGVNDYRNPSTYYSNQSNKTLYNPTRDQYDFVNWTYNGTAVTQINASWAADVELIANWNPKGYSITYNLDGGTNNASNPSFHGIETDEIHLQAPTKNGYTFTGWTGSNGDIPELEVTIPAGDTSNLSYTAHWSLNTYQISYVLNGGTNDPSNPVSYTVLDAIITLKSPSKDHYDFLGWKSGDNSISKIYTSNATDYVLTATWTPHSYSINYDYNGGTGENPTTHSIESEEITLNEPVRNGYTFTGWTGSNGDIPNTNVIIEAGNTEDLHYSANWSLNTYTITYHLDGGSNHIKNPSTYTIEDTISLKDASKNYYSFEGWFTDPEFTNRIDSLNGQFGDLNLYAKFVPFTYQANFNLNGGYLSYNVTVFFYDNCSYNKTYKVCAGAELDLANINSPTRDGQVIGGWYFDPAFEQPYYDGYRIKSDITLYAKWISLGSSYTQLTSSTTVSAYGSNGRSATKYFYVPYYSTGNVQLICKTTMYHDTNCYIDAYYFGYLLDVNTNERLFTRGGTYGSAKDGTYDLVLTPGHKYMLYAYGEYVTFSNGKKAYGTAKLSVENLETWSTIISTENTFEQSYQTTTIYPSTCYKDGYDFAGWYDENGNLISDVWNYTSDQSFHAEWTAHNYSIQYVLNGGTNNFSNPSSYNVNDDVALSDPAREGYRFNGWYTDPSFKNRVEQIHGSDHQDYVLYAQWIPETYHATLDYNGGQNCPTVNFYSNGEIIKSVDLYKDSTLAYFVPDAPQAALQFAGWYLDSACTVLYSFDGKLNHDLNLYAKWIDISDCYYTELGSNCDIHIDGVNISTITFVPTSNQTITITSVSDMDLYCELYDANGVLLTSNDDASDTNLNFSITVTLEAGKQYFLKCRGNQASISGDCYVTFAGTNTFTFNVVGEYTEIIEGIDATYNVSFELPTPKKEGYTFLGWYDEHGNLVDESSWNYTSNMTLYAHWAPAE